MRLRIPTVGHLLAFAPSSLELLNDSWAQKYGSRFELRSITCSLRIAFALVLTVLLTSSVLASQNTQTSQPTDIALINKDIITMVSAGLTQEIILAKIKTSVCYFDTAPEQLAELKKSGVPDMIILAMIQVPTTQLETFSFICASAVSSGEIGLHATKDLTSPIVTKSACGDKLVSLGEDNGYLRVRTEHGDVGYILRVFLSKTTPEVQNAKSHAPPTETAGEVGYADCGGTGNVSVFLPGSGNIGKNGTVVATLTCGQEVLVLHEENGWTRIRTKDNIEGTVRDDYISAVKIPARISPQRPQRRENARKAVQGIADAMMAYGWTASPHWRPGECQSRQNGGTTRTVCAPNDPNLDACIYDWETTNKFTCRSKDGQFIRY